MEKTNQRTILNEIVSEIKLTVDDIQKSPSKEILDASFISALEGIRKGKMSYEGDKVLPKVKEAVDQKIKSFKKMSKEE